MPQKIKIFLTGGTGFFGRAILRHIRGLNAVGAGNYRVTVMTRSEKAFLTRYPEFEKLEWLDFYEGNVLDGQSAFPCDLYFRYVLHAAASATISPKMPPIERFEEIVLGTRNVLEFASRINAERFLFVSSGAVYGDQLANEESLSEDRKLTLDSLCETGVYGIAKLQAESLVSMYARRKGFQFVIARCFCFCGPDLDLQSHFAICSFIRDALTSDSILVLGNGMPVRSYLEQSDLANWLLTLLERGRSGEAYNVGSDLAISLADLAATVGRVLAPDKTIIVRDGTSSASTGRYRYVPSIAKAKIDLGLSVTVSLESAIKTMAYSERD